MKIEIEIKPDVVGDYGGPWVIKTTFMDGEAEGTVPDVTYATEAATEAVELAMTQTFPGIEEYYR